MALPSSCPSPTQLRELLDGTLPAPEQDACSAHLETCPACQSSLESLAAGARSWQGAADQLGRSEATAEWALEQAIHELKSQATAVETTGESASAADLPADFLTPSEDPQYLGRLGHYEVMEIIGRGGFGIVLKAMDTVLHRLVAIKVLAPQLATNATARKRFTREAQAAAAVSHDHVVTIHAVEEARGIPYLVMPYIAGVSLQQRLNRSGPLELKEILRIGMQTAAGLAAAHAQGLIHRDIKPANILLENGVERVKITDFGLARAADDASLSQSGVIAGTPQYMAPEQARGENIDHRADLFSLGSVLYALCTGRPPFRASTAMGVLKRVCEEVPRPIRETNPEIPEWLEEIIVQLHAKNPDDRFQSAGEVAELLEQHLAHLQQPGTVPQPPRLEVPAVLPWLKENSALLNVWSRKLRRAQAERQASWVGERQKVKKRKFTRELVVGFLVLLLVIALLWLSTGTAMVRVALTPYPNIEYQDDVRVIVKRGGREVAEIKADSWTNLPLGYYDLFAAGCYKYQSARSGVLTVSPAHIYLTPFTVRTVNIGIQFDAEPSQQNTSKAEIPASGVHVSELPPLRGHKAPVKCLGFSPDNQWLASASHDNTVNLWRWNGTGYTLFQALILPAGVRGVAFSSDSTTVAAAGYDSVVRIFKFKAGSSWTLDQELLGHKYHVLALAFAPGGDWLVSAGGLWPQMVPGEVRIWILTQDGRLFEGKDLGKVHGQNVNGLAFSPDGKFLATTGADRYLRIWRADRLARDCPLDPDKCLVDKFPAPVGLNGVAFSPDGQMIAAGCGDGAVKRWIWDGQFWRISSDLVGFTKDVWGVVYSRDGKLLVAGSDGTVKIWDAVSGRDLGTLQGHSREVGYLALSRNNILAVPGLEGTVKLWKLGQLTQPPGKPEPVTRATPFVILARETRPETKLASLAEAVAAARDGDTIEIGGNGPFLTPRITIHGKALTIRAAAGLHPVLEPSQEAIASNSPLFETDAQLGLEGLELRWTKERPGQSDPLPNLLALHKAPFFASRCRFVFDTQQPGIGILADQSPRFEVRNSMFLTRYPEAAAITYVCPENGRFLLSQCMQVGGKSVTVHYRGVEPADVFLKFEHNTLVGESFLALILDMPVGKKRWRTIGVDLSKNIIDMRHYALVCGQSEYYLARQSFLSAEEVRALLPQLVAWHDAENVFRLGYGFLTAAQMSAPLNLGDFKHLSDWQQFWGKSQSQSWLEAKLQYQGGDVRAKRAAGSLEISPLDLRLAGPNSARHTASDALPVGVQGELVGPGASSVAAPAPRSAAEPTTKATPFVIPARQGRVEKKLATLAEAVAAAGNGDTIEVRGPGPFITPSIAIKTSALTIRAATGEPPVLRLSAEEERNNQPVLESYAPLTLEGIQIERTAGPRTGTLMPYTVRVVHAPLRVANCRFVIHGDANAIWADSCSLVEIRNCEFIGGGLFSHIDCLPAPGTRIVLENNILARQDIGFSFHHRRTDLRDVSIRLVHNTIVADDALSFFLDAVPTESQLTRAPSGRVFRLDAEQNVFDGARSILQFEQSPEFLAKHESYGPKSSEDVLKQLLNWRDDRNLYSERNEVSAIRLSAKNLNMPPLESDLRSNFQWEQFWKQDSVLIGFVSPRFKGGDVRSRLARPGAKLSAADFEHNLTAGYLKDAGPKMSLVGPGEAYEGWKKTPEYQQWVKEIAEEKPGEN